MEWAESCHWHRWVWAALQLVFGVWGLGNHLSDLTCLVLSSVATFNSWTLLVMQLVISIVLAPSTCACTCTFNMVLHMVFHHCCIWSSSMLHMVFQWSMLPWYCATLSVHHINNIMCVRICISALCSFASQFWNLDIYISSWFPFIICFLNLQPNFGIWTSTSRSPYGHSKFQPFPTYSEQPTCVSTDRWFSHCCHPTCVDSVRVHRFCPHWCAIVVI